MIPDSSAQKISLGRWKADRDGGGNAQQLFELAPDDDSYNCNMQYFTRVTEVWSYPSQTFPFKMLRTNLIKVIGLYVTNYSLTLTRCPSKFLTNETNVTRVTDIASSCFSPPHTLRILELFFPTHQRNLECIVRWILVRWLAFVLW